jgi:hypothetical protein
VLVIADICLKYPLDCNDINSRVQVTPQQIAERVLLGIVIGVNPLKLARILEVGVVTFYAWLTVEKVIVRKGGHSQTAVVIA